MIQNGDEEVFVELQRMGKLVANLRLGGYSVWWERWKHILIIFIKGKTFFENEEDVNSPSKKTIKFNIK